MPTRPIRPARLAFPLAAAVLLAAALPARAEDPWPAEPAGEAENLTPIEGPEPNDFHLDLSGAFWNPVTRRLWIVRNGPGGDQSKLWAAVEDGLGSFRIDERATRRGEWTDFGDLEDVTQADLAEDVVYLMIEGEERIREYDVSVYGTATLRNNWDTRAHLPLSGGYGAEGIAFVPDAALVAAGFVDAAGSPRASRRGMGGLMFVGHQNGGRVYVFDLDRTSGTFDYVGEYATGYGETAALAFDRSTSRLYAWHDDADVLEVLSLASEPVAGQPYRKLTPLRAYRGPDARNNEGIALLPVGECVDGRRDFFMAIDGGGYSSLLRYRRFTDGCPANTAPADVRGLRRSDVR